MTIDWGDGCYELTATTLREVAGVVLDCAELKPNERLLDLGCGTGNAALEASRRGTRAVGVDPAARLIDVARSTASAEGLSARFEVGDASAIPFPDDSFDIAISVFGVIFAPDPARAASELVRIVHGNGRIVFTSWLPTGAMSRVGTMLRDAFPQVAVDKPRAPPLWGDEAYVRALFDEATTGRAKLSVTQHAIAFHAPSPEAWLEQVEAHHPVWRAAGRELAASPRVASDLHDRSLQVLREMNEDPNAFCATSRYLVVRVDA